MNALVVPQLCLGFISLSCVLLRATHATMQSHYARQTSAERSGAPPQVGGERFTPSVDVIVPCFNERPDLLEACCRSLAAQDYPGHLHVWLVDDGSRNLDELQPILGRYRSLCGWTVARSHGNQGKRKAQDLAFQDGDGELVITVDSDTDLEPDGIRQIVARFADHRVGAVTADVRVANRDASWLTRLIDTRYRLLFEQERAAQSHFGAVLCCAGPFSAYRRSALARVWPAYLNTRFLGRDRVCGDDLELTNLVLGLGYRSHYQPAARAGTDVPTTLRGYFRQQLRWNRSFYRQLGQLLRLLRGRHGFLWADVAARTVLPLLLLAALAVAAGDVAWFGRSHLPMDVGLVAAVKLTDMAAALAQTRSVRFAVGYGLVYVGLLLPDRLVALCTLTRSCWETRHREPATVS
jgi:N-acetylglucosaminyltransferase